MLCQIRIASKLRWFHISNPQEICMIPSTGIQLRSAQQRIQRNGQLGKCSRLQCMPPFTQKVMDTVKAAFTANL